MAVVEDNGAPTQETHRIHRGHADNSLLATTKRKAAEDLDNAPSPTKRIKTSSTPEAPTLSKPLKIVPFPEKVRS